MAEPQKDMSKDKDVIEAVGYGFDASVRKGTAAGQKAMEGFMSKLSEEQKMFARDAFNKKIASQSKVLDNKARIPKGEEQVKVYRKAAQEKPARVIDYKKEFATAPKKNEAAASKLKPAAEPTAPTAKKRSFSRPSIAKPAATPAPAKPAAKAAPTPAKPRTVGAGPSQMLNLSQFSTKPAAKAAPTPAKPSPKTTPAAPIRKAMGMPAAPKSDKVNVPGMGMMDKDAAMRMRAFKK